MSLLQASVQSISEDTDAEAPPLHAFVVRSPKLAFVFQAASQADKTAWMQAIVQVIELRREGNQSRINAAGKSGGGGGGPATATARDELMVLSARSSSVGAPSALRGGRKASLPVTGTDVSDDLDVLVEAAPSKGGSANNISSSSSSNKNNKLSHDSEGGDLESDDSTRRSASGGGGGSEESARK